MHHCLLIHADNLKGHNNTLRFFVGGKFQSKSVTWIVVEWINRKGLQESVVFTPKYQYALYAYSLSMFLLSSSNFSLVGKFPLLKSALKSATIHIVEQNSSDRHRSQEFMGSRVHQIHLVRSS